MHKLVNEWTRNPLTNQDKICGMVGLGLGILLLRILLFLQILVMMS